MAPTLTELAPFLVLALFGSLHCAGMCGAFAIAAASSARNDGRAAWLGSLSYVIGKAMTYALLGAIAASAGGFATRTVGASFESSRLVLGWLVGVSLCLAGFATLGFRLPQLTRGRTLAPLRAARTALDGVRRARGVTASFGIGVVTGLLPCGLSWSALLLALQSHPGTAVAGLFVFGIATGPALFGVASGWHMLPAAWRMRARYALGPVLVLIGLTTIARVHRDALPEPLRVVVPECCSEPH